MRGDGDSGSKMANVPRKTANKLVNIMKTDSNTSPRTFPIKPREMLRHDFKSYDLIKVLSVEFSLWKFFLHES